VGKNTLEVTEEKRLRWFGHVKRMPGNRLLRKVLEWELEGTRRRGRPKERWTDGVRRSMTNILHAFRAKYFLYSVQFMNQVKGKAVPQDSNGGAGGRGYIAPTHSRPRH
jgi:hypothetical protein